MTLRRRFTKPGEVAGFATRARCNSQVWTVGKPDAVRVAHEVEGAVEADAWRLRALLAVMFKAAHKRVGRTEPEGAHPTIDDYDNGRFDFLDQAGLVIPLRGIGGTAARRISRGSCRDSGFC